MAPGDIVLLPKGVAHAWRAYGEAGGRFTVTCVPRGFEAIVQTIEGKGLAIMDIEALTATADDLGLDIVGPPLSHEEVAQTVAAG